MSFLTLTEETLIPQPTELNGKRTVKLSAVDVAGVLRPKAKDSDGNLIDFLGPTGPQGVPGPPAPIIAVADISNPVELAGINLSLTGDTIVIVKQNNAGVEANATTLYMALAMIRPFAPLSPYVVNDSTSGQFLAVGGRFFKGSSTFEKAINRGGMAEFIKATAQAFIVNATDEVILLDTGLNVDPEFYSLASSIITFIKAGRFKVQLGANLIGIASTTARVGILDAELAPAVGAFVKIPRSRRYGSDLNNTRPKSVQAAFEIDVIAGDRLRIVGNISTVASSTEIQNIDVLIEKIK